MRVGHILKINFLIELAMQQDLQENTVSVFILQKFIFNSTSVSMQVIVKFTSNFSDRATMS